jgi:hypothetical protein
VEFEHITPAEWAYFAGIIDGEGCINIHAQKSRKGEKVFVYYTLFLVVGNTSYSMLKWLHDRFGGSFVPRGNTVTQKQIWHWGVASQQAENLLRNILPYLVAKVDQAELALQFRDSYKGLKPCGRRPLPIEISEFRGKCKIELSRIKNPNESKEDVA